MYRFAIDLAFASITTACGPSAGIDDYRGIAVPHHQVDLAKQTVEAFAGKLLPKLYFLFQEPDADGFIDSGDGRRVLGFTQGTVIVIAMSRDVTCPGEAYATTRLDAQRVLGTSLVHELVH